MSEVLNAFEFKDIKCPVCGSGDTRKLGYRGGDAHQGGLGVRTTIVRCLKCTHQFPNPMPFPKISLSDLYGEADEYFERHDLEHKKATSKSLISELERRLGRKGKLLDIGCGRGELLWAARDAGWECEGVDTSEEFIEFGKKILGVEGRLGTLQDAGFASESFDAVIMGGVIEHLYDPGATLKEILRLLRPGGWFYFDAPNEDGLYMRAGNAYMKMLGRDWVVALAPTFSPYHVQGFNPASIKKIVEVNNFKVCEFRIFGEVSPQTGKQTLRKSTEYQASRLINWFGRKIGQGMYMDVWAQKADQ